MFVERSEARIRSARTAFVLACLVPTVGIAAWAAYRATDFHRDLAMAEWARGIGLGVHCGRMVHVRPGCVRIVDGVVRDESGAAEARFDLVEIETTPAEVRVRLPLFDATPQACAAIGRMARSWLAEPARHGRNWLVDARAVRWREAAVDGVAPRSGIAVAPGNERLDAGFRVECVAAGGERAVRIRREPANGDEVRVVRTAVAGRERFSVEGSLAGSVPASCVVAAIMGRPAEVSGWCSGSVAIESGADGWDGDIAGVLDGFRADAISGFFGSPWRLDGRARLELVRGSFSGGRLSRAEATLDIGSGGMSQGLLDRLVQVAQCRAGEAYRGGEAIAAAETRPFDRVALTLTVDAVGVTIRPSGPSDGIVWWRTAPSRG